MAIGSQATQPGLNSSLTQLAIQMREVCQDAQDFNLFVAQLGTAGLEAIGFAPADATALIAAAAVLNTVAAVYYGTATQATTFNFNNSLSPYWAGG